MALSVAEETILQSDRVPIFIGTNRLFLKKGVQSSNRTVEIPNTDIEEQGNPDLRGVSIQAPRVSFTLEDLSVDMDMEQYLAATYATLSSTAFAGSGNIISFRANGKSGVVPYIVGATDKITGVILAYSSNSIRLGEGAKFVGSTASVLTLVSAANNVNFAVGDSVQVQKQASAVTSTVGTVSRISGTKITVTGLTIASSVTNSGYIFVSNNTNNITKAQFLAGTPIVMKGIEVFAVKNAVSVAPGAGNALVADIGVIDTPAAGIDTNSWKDSLVDIVMLYNDYEDNLIFSRYVQDAGCTSVGFNFSAEGNATQSYDFTTGKSIDYRGYVLRRAIVASASATSLVLSAMFGGSEGPEAIETNSTFNEFPSYQKRFLKLVTIDKNGVRKVWEETESAPASDEYIYVNATDTITFGSTVALGTRIEGTFLCKVANINTVDYKFDETAFSHVGTPDAVTGKYQPLVINTSDYDSRVDGVESSNFTVTFARDYFDAQGILSTRIRPASRGTVEGSFSTREGFSKTMRVVTDGTYDVMADGMQLDASKASVYTNTNTVPLGVRLYDPKDNASVVKTVTIPGIQVTNISNANSAGGDSTFSVNFKGKKGKATITR